MRFILCIFFLCFLTLLSAQPDSLYQDAKAAFEARNFDQSYTMYEKAGDAFEVEKNWSKFLRCRVEMARCSQFTSVVSRAAIKEIIDPAIAYIQSDSAIWRLPEAAECFQFYARYFWSVEGDYQAAIEAYEESLTIAEILGDTANFYRMSSLSDLSHVYSNQEQFDKALRYAQQALALSREIYGEDHLENGPRYYTLGFTYYRKGHFERALTEIQKGIEIIQTQEGPEMQIGLGYNNLSAVYVAMLDPEGALQSSNAAMQILSKYLGPDHEAIGTIEWDLAVLYADLKEFEVALGHYLRAKEIFEKNFGPSFPQLPQLYHQYAQCLDQLHDFAEAEKWHLRAREINMASHGPLHPRTGDSYRNLADHYTKSGQMERAASELQKGFDVIAQGAINSDLLKAWLYQSKGSLLFTQQNYLASSEAYGMAARAVCNLPTDESDPIIENTYNPLIYTDAFIEKSKVLNALFEQSRDQNHLSAALDATRKADQGIRKLRSSYHSPEAKLFLQQRARSHYDLMIHLLFDMWVLTKDRKLLDEAWKISEQTKSLLLFEQVMTGDLLAFTMPETDFDSLSNMQKELNFLRHKIDEQFEFGDTTNAAISQESYFALSNRLQVYQASLSAKHPKFASLQSDLSPIETGSLMESLSSSQVLIEYYLTENELFSFVVTNREIRWFRKDAGPEFRSQLNRYNHEIRNLNKILDDPLNAIRDHREVSAVLHEYLLPEVLMETIKNAEQIVIVPDQDLGYVSFESLCKDARTQSYIIDEYSVSYTYSASLYGLSSGKAKDLAFEKFAGFAPSYFAFDTSALPGIDDAYAQLSRAGRLDLPGAQKEVEEINKIVNGNIWLSESATEDNFKTNAGAYTIIHLALHGRVDEAHPMKSELLFHSDKDRSGKLRASEIYDLSLSANLAVLSACNTATGSINAGEGILSLSRAFAFAGVPNLVASLWRADDQASSQIMISFYEHLAEGKTKDQALRLAKLQYLQSQRADAYRHPYFWSSYIYMGESNSSFVEPIRPLWWILLGLLLSSVLLFAYRKSRSKAYPIEST